MRLLSFFGFLLLLPTLFACKNDRIARTTGLLPPVAKVVPHFFTEYGKKRGDNYFWLSNPKDTAVINYLKAENTYSEQSLAHTKPLQEKLFSEMTSRLEQQTTSVPIKKNGYWYYSRFEKGSEYAVEYRKKAADNAAEEVLLDRPNMAKNFKVFRLLEWEINQANNMVAYLVDTSGDRRNTLFFKNLTNNQLLGETVSDVANGGLAFSDDGNYLFYIKNDPTVRGSRLFRHQIGQNPATDQLIYEEKDATFSIDLKRSMSGKYILLSASSTTTSECRFVAANAPLAPFNLIQLRQKDLLYQANHFGDEADFHLLTNANNAKNFKIVNAPVATPQYANWKDVIQHNDTILIEDFVVFKKYVVTQEKIKGLSNISIIDRADNSFKIIDFGEETFDATMTIGDYDVYDSDSIRYAYTSLTTPKEVIKYNFSNNQKLVLKQDKIKNFSVTDYETHRIWATADDKTRVPISLVYRKDKFLHNGENPCFLYAYGSYGINTDPVFRPEIISLLDRGFVFAIAHIRGGQEMGRNWYENGKMLKKKNTFTDFTTCAKHLIAEKYTKSAKLFANGRSAGGMLMGAITNLEPNLFKGVIAEVPWMDIITDMFNDQLPLTTLEYDEWGNPNNKTYYDYMLSWSPYDQLKPANYPAILATGGLNDTQVPYYSPAKWVAKMRTTQTGKNPIYLKTDLETGHGGKSGRFNRYEATAFKYVFMLDLLGIEE
jgi:oligopeptidase B